MRKPSEARRNLEARARESFRFRWVALALALSLLAGVWAFYPTAGLPGGSGGSRVEQGEMVMD